MFDVRSSGFLPTRPVCKTILSFALGSIVHREIPRKPQFLCETTTLNAWLRVVRETRHSAAVRCTGERHRSLLGSNEGLVRIDLPFPYSCSGRGLGGNRLGAAHPHPRPDGIGQDVGGLPLGHRPAGNVSTTRGAGALSRGVRLPPESAGLRHRPEPACPTHRNPDRRGAPRRPATPHLHGHANRRHTVVRATADAPPSPGHPHHHPGKPLLDAHVAGQGDPDPGSLGHRGRGSLRRRHQARHPSRSLARAAHRDRRPPNRNGSGCRPPSDPSRRFRSSWGAASRMAMDGSRVPSPSSMRPRKSASTSRSSFPWPT